MSSDLLHVAGLDVERGHERAFNHWYESDYVPRALDRPGWVTVRRYQCLEGEPRYLSIFDLTPEALDGDVSAAPFREPSFSRRIRDYHARTWRRILAIGDDPASAGMINIITVDIDAEHADPFNRWYSEKHTPEIVACPGWLGGERFESLDGDPRFMAIYGLEDPDRPFATDEYEAVVGWDEHVRYIRGYHGFRIYELVGRIEATA